MEALETSEQTPTRGPAVQTFQRVSRISDSKRGTGFALRETGLRGELPKGFTEQTADRQKAKVRIVEESESDAVRRLQESFDRGWAKISALMIDFENKYCSTNDNWTARRKVQGWQGMAMRGLFASLFGVLILCWQGIPILTLVLIFGVYTLGERKWELVLSALVGFCIGFFTVAWPGLTALALLYLIAAGAALGGALMVLNALRLRKELKVGSLAILDGFMSFGFGVALASLPLTGAAAVSWVTGISAFIFGLLLSLRAKRMLSRTSVL